MLQHSPQAGLRGVAVDTLRLLLGMRLPGNCIITLIFHLPLPLAALTHTTVILLTRNNAAYCQQPVRRQQRRQDQPCSQSRAPALLLPCPAPALLLPCSCPAPALLLPSLLSRKSASARLLWRAPLPALPAALQLLSHPAMVRRLQLLWAGMDISSTTVSPVGSAVVALQADPGGRERECRVALSFLQAAACLLPVAVLAWQAKLNDRLPRHGAQQQRQQRQQGAAQASWRGGSGGTLAVPLQRARPWLEAAWRAAMQHCMLSVHPAAAGSTGRPLCGCCSQRCGN
jgi:hypothetical protein